jgi:hypothetical protein
MTNKTERKPATNSTFAIGGVSCSSDSLVVAESSVLRINISGKNPAHRKSANRYATPVMQRGSFVSLNAALSPFFL